MPEGLKARRALVVDDDHGSRALESMLLGREGFSVDAAADGREAVRLVASDNPYSVIVLDLMMPEMNGFDFLEHLRAVDPEGPRRVLVVTAAVWQTHGHVPADVHRILVKPFDVREFRVAVAACAGS